MPPSLGGGSSSAITGTWDLVVFRNGGNAGWEHVTGTFDGSGNLTSFSNYVDSDGSVDPGGTPDTPLKWTFDSDGVIIETDNNVTTFFHGLISTDKKLVIGVDTDNTSIPYTRSMLIARKQTGTSFSNADLVNIPFAFHSLSSGQDNNWSYGAGSTNASRQLTLTSSVGPGGPDPNPPPPNFDTMSVSSAGIVTLANDNAFYGLMTDDKKVIFAIDGDINVQNGIYNLIVITITGPTFTLADLEGTTYFVSIRNILPNGQWNYGSITYNTSGTGTYGLWKDNAGSPKPGNVTRAISVSGVLTDNTAPVPDTTYHGQIFYNKDGFVRTGTSGGGGYQLSISVK